MNALEGKPLGVPLEVSPSEASIETHLNWLCCFVTAAAIGRLKLSLMGLLLHRAERSWLLCSV